MGSILCNFMIKKQLRVEYEEAQIWEWTRSDRVTLADFLAQLSPENLSARTLCPEWSVSDVAAHILSMATNTKWQLTWKYLQSGLNVEKASERTIAETHDRSEYSVSSSHTLQTLQWHSIRLWMFPWSIFWWGLSTCSTAENPTHDLLSPVTDVSPWWTAPRSPMGST